MTAQCVLDRPLNALLVSLAERLAGSCDRQVLICGDDLAGVRADCIDILFNEGLLAPAEPARAVSCEGCERGCFMDVNWTSGTTPSLFIVCDKRYDIGRVAVERARLQTWQTS